MSVSAISSGAGSAYDFAAVDERRQQFQQQFGRLGKDLAAGNLAAAQADFATLQQNAPATDLQAANPTAAQQDFTALQQALQTPRAPHHHHRHVGGLSGAPQLFQELGQDLQSGNAAAAQKAYNSLAQLFGQTPIAASMATGSTAPANSSANFAGA